MGRHDRGQTNYHQKVEPEKMPPRHRKLPIDANLAHEAKALVALAFRNGPIEDVHAGKECPTCAGKPEYSHITQRAVDRLYAYLWIRTHCPDVYPAVLRSGNLYTLAERKSRRPYDWLNLEVILG
jgi:hypothetical protein